MPLLSPPPTVETEPPPWTRQPTNSVGWTWTDPSGTVWDLMHRAHNGTGALVLPGVKGTGAAPRETVEQALAAGGAYGRRSNALPKTLIFPMHWHADTPAEFHDFRRALTLAFTSTVPPADAPRPGVMRFTRPNGQWREISLIYTDGLDWTDDDTNGIIYDRPVVEFRALDPWWYGPRVVALQFAVSVAADYLAPYETVSPSTVLGEQDITIDSDVPVSPVWTITGPASSVTAGIVGGRSWTIGAITADEVITIDIAAKTITDQTGANRAALLDRPTASMFTLPPGVVRVNVDLQGGSSGPPPSSIRLEYRSRRETA